ncbi:zinc-binding alcohol dehydrogenase family protein [Marinoscillum sp.]|uniref:zinc-binding alcohol dehydrogenase family protein n=1 Tax=Marinoscillum sp. TaxID=2024838 RepID=UPI003BACD596
MKAAITTRPGPPSVIEIKEVPAPEVKNGWIKIKVKAFGLNRSEMFTRKGDSPGVEFPRIQGIECVGVVEEDPSGKMPNGQQVAALMGGMGRFFDGGYAEYALVPESIVFPFQSTLPWEVIGALPEMFQTVWGSLHQALEIERNETLLIRGGTSSIGMTACEMARHQGLTVIATTRNPAKETSLKDNGADHVIIDDGTVAGKLRDLFPSGVDKVLELVGTATLKDSLKCIRPKGVVCMTGILGNEWTMADFTPMGDIPSLGRLTVYMGEAANLPAGAFQQYLDLVEVGEVKPNIDRVFRLSEVEEAHSYMESNQATGKLVVLLD